MAKKYKAGVVVWREGNAGISQILLVTARQFPDSWIFPVGTIDPGETAAQAAARECWEESGYTVDIADKIGKIALKKKKHTHHFTFFLGHVTGEIEHWETDRQRQWLPITDLLDTIAPVFYPIAEKVMSMSDKIGNM